MLNSVLQDIYLIEDRLLSGALIDVKHNLEKDHEFRSERYTSWWPRKVYQLGQRIQYDLSIEARADANSNS